MPIVRISDLKKRRGGGEFHKILAKFGSKVKTYEKSSN